jgi:glycosyltransferase involved in cell wall biosynthesis
MPERSVLMIAYDFPPGRGIGGGLRSGFFARYLPESGWRTRVIALDQGQGAQPGVTRMASPTPWQWPYEVTPYGWANALGRYLRRWSEPIDLVYVSCPPFPQALAAASFARDRGLPLVVDFRDAWSLDPYQEGSRLKRALYRHLFPALERKLLLQTDLLILNTPSALQAYKELYPQHAERMQWLPNGFDGQAFAGAHGPTRRDYLQLLYAGRFGIGARSPDNLLQGLLLARVNGCDVRLQVLGDQSEAMRSRIEQARMGDMVELIDQVDYAEAAKRMCAADVLVLIQAPARARVQAVAGKTYDYLRAGRPVLAVAPPGDNIDLLKNHACRLEHPGDDPAAIADAIERLYRAWQQGQLESAAEPVSELAQFDRRHLAQRLAGHFDRLVQAREAGG